MRMDNLLALRRSAFVATTDSDHELLVHLNLASRMQLNGINQLWVADITFIRLQQEFVYLAVILDAYSRKVVGWALDRSLAAQLAITALQNAISSRTPTPGLVHHSDRGIQYASAEYGTLLDKHQIIASMSRLGNPWDKAYASYCTCCEPCTTFSGNRRRLASLTPCALRGGLGPGSSYSQSSRSFTG